MMVKNTKICRLSQKQVIRRKIGDYSKKYDRIDVYKTKDKAAVQSSEKGVGDYQRKKWDF